MPEHTPLQDLPLFASPGPASENAHRLAAVGAIAADDDPTHVPAAPTGTTSVLPGSGTGRVPDADPGHPNVPAVPDRSRRRARTSARYDASQVDWALVRSYRQLASQQLADLLKDRPAIDDDDRRELGRSVVRRLLNDQAESDALAGDEPVSADNEAALAQAVMDSLFGLGRLQPLVDDDSIEDIEITGASRVVILHADGRVSRGSPVADSDEELVEFLSFLASRRTDSGERPFSWANPELRLALPGRARLSALAWVTPQPIVRIRMHRHIDISLDDLEAMGMVDQTLAAFLAAAIRARRSVVIAGDMGAGKTTLLRALARAIPDWESVGTMETEYELYLDQVGDRLRPPITIEARPGSGEIGPTGRAAGELTVEDLFPGLLRQNLNRIIVGEVRGGEVTAMFKAMQAGAGSLSTIHAKNARDTIGRLATLVHGTGMSMTYAYRQVAQHIDLIVHVASRRDPVSGRRYRYVAEVIEVNEGDGVDTHIGVTDVFERGPDGRAVPSTVPTFVDDLTEHGFDPAALNERRSGWRVAMEDLR